MNKRAKQFVIGVITALVVLVTLPLFAAFEAHVVNVTAKVENALFVHPESLNYGTVFPQEKFDTSFGMMFSQSFSADGQTRVGRVDYVIKQKPKPRENKVAELGGIEAARDWCHTNAPANVGDPNDPYYVNCYPTLCPYLSKHPDGNPSTGPNANNDIGLPPFHNPETEFASGKLVKFNQFGNTIDNDPIDTWTVDLAVPCFENHCAQDWAAFVHAQNPQADPDKYMAPEGLEHEVFGCDIWVEVTKIY